MEDMNKDTQIGFHKGALTTLLKEKEALVNMLNIVDQLIQMHSRGLQELGVDVTKETSQVSEEPRKKKMPIEDIL
jgi:hypothetical protein